MKPKRPKWKFKAGQVVMTLDREQPYAVKLKKRAFVHVNDYGTAWYDSLGELEYECELRPLTARERGGR